MMTEFNISDVRSVKFTAVSFETLPGGCFVIEVGGVGAAGGFVELAEVKFHVWDPEVWDHFCDIERALVGPLRDPGQPQSEASMSPQPPEVPVSTRRSIMALLRLLHEELAELVEVSDTADLRVVDAGVRNVEGDVERVRYELDTLLRGTPPQAAGAMEWGREE